MLSRLKPVLLLLLASICYLSCQKELEPFEDTGTETPPAENEPDNSCKLVRLQQGTDVADDTVYLAHYDSLERIDYLYDSVYDDTIKIKYISDSSNVIKSVKDESFYTSFTYNDSGWISNVYSTAGDYIYEYDSAGLITKKQEYVSSSLFRYYTFLYNADHDLVSRKEYSGSDILLGETTFEYNTAVSNSQRFLCLLNYVNGTGSDEIFHPDFYNNRHAVKAYTKTGIDSGEFSASYTLDAKGNIIQSVSTRYENVFTRFYSYDCR